MLTISKTFEFSASHILSRPDWDEETNRKVFGKCANPNGHGHNYKLEVVVAGALSPDTGMILNTRELENIVQEGVLQDVDHVNLNYDVPWLQGQIPTSEVIVEAMWKRLSAKLSKSHPHVKLRRLKLHETRTIWAEKEE